MPNRRRIIHIPNLGDLVSTVAVVGFVWAVGSGGCEKYINKADKVYVDDGIRGVRQYTDEKSAQTLKEAFEHSDANKQSMMIEIGKFGAAQQSQGVKIDMMLEAVNRLQSDVTIKRK